MVFPLDDNFVFGDNFFFLADNFFFAEGDKKNYSAKKKNYSPTNEVTHPTETPLYLWYDVFMPPLFLAQNRKKNCGRDLKIEFNNMSVLHINYKTKLSR